jgi:hypothetical protein
LYQGHPLFRTAANQLRRYLNQIPEDFEMCCKVWEEITIPTYAQHARYGIKGGQPNPRFLDVGAFIDLVLTPYREAGFQPPIAIRFRCSGTDSLVKNRSI